ncbi:hypothetical protein H6F96_19325 [Microcoleus sp. FACHB-53]|nr:hypothetical protein [Microcoleus sp. FACHB-53]MBD2124915.1 hypothetical protein [Microcoleus sp. FACHB-1]
MQQIVTWCLFHKASSPAELTQELMLSSYEGKVNILTAGGISLGEARALREERRADRFLD